MARLRMNRHKEQKTLTTFCTMWINILNLVTWYIRAVQTAIAICLDMCPSRTHYKMLCPERKEYMHRLVYKSDAACLHQLIMNR